MRLSACFAAFSLIVLTFVNTADAQRRRREAPPPVTQDDEARLLFEAGTSAYGEGRFEDALNRFREAYRMSQRPVLLFNIGQAADRLGRRAEALEAFEQYLAEVADAPNRAMVSARMEVLRREVEEEEARAAAVVQPTAVATATEQPASEDPLRDTEHRSVVEQWWFWTIVGVVVVTAVTVPLALRDSAPGLPEGDFGGPVQARTRGGVTW